MDTDRKDGRRFLSGGRKAKRSILAIRMKYYSKWRSGFLLITLSGILLSGWIAGRGFYIQALLMTLILLAMTLIFFGFWRNLKRQGIRTEVDISRVLGKDAKGALSFGGIGILTYNNEYICTWQSPYLKEQGMDLVNQKLTVFSENIRKLFEDEEDMVIAHHNGQTYEIAKKENAQILFVKNITELYNLRQQFTNDELVIGVLSLDNYNEYQTYENEELMSAINAGLRGAVVAWAKEYGMFFRRIRSDRYLVLLDMKIFREIRNDNFKVLQTVKDRARRMDVSITLSMVFVYGSNSFAKLDHMISELMELVVSRGGDQVAIRQYKQPVEFIGGNSEKSSGRSKARVAIMTSSIEDLIHASPRVYILGHKNTDYDCAGAALAVSSWVRSLKGNPAIVLKDVAMDAQLQDTMKHYNRAIRERHTFVSEEEALRNLDPEKDLVIMVDHSVPAISSGQALLAAARRTMIIDHHRRGENSLESPLLSYVESKASSTCELVTEMLLSTNVSVPIYEAEATIMYLGVLVDTNRFKSHTSERTFQAAAVLKSWGASSDVAEQALKEDYGQFQEKNKLIRHAQEYRDKFMIATSEEPVSRTLMSQCADALLLIKGCNASFTIAVNETNGKIAVSARGDGSCNVQKVMEQMGGGGHFSAAAAELDQTSVEEVEKKLKEILDKEDFSK